MIRKSTNEELKHRVKELEQGNSELKQLAKELQENEERFRYLTENSTDWIWEFDENEIFTYASKAIKNILGYTPEEVLGKSAFDLIPSPERERVKEEFAHLKEERKPFANLLNVNQHKNGSMVSLESSGVPIVDSEGIFYGYRGIDRDISERRRSEEMLRESEEKFRSLVELTSDLIWEINQNGIYTYIDPKVKDFLGYKPEEVVGKPYRDFVAENNKERLALSFKDHSENPRPFSRLNNIQLHKDGRRRIVETSGLPIFDIDGKLVGWRGIDTDITERVRIEEMMIQAEKMLSVGGLAAGMAHEINNPLAGIMQNVQVMKNRMSGELSKNIAAAEECGTSIEAIEIYMEKRGMFSMIESVLESGKRAAKIVNNMLSFSRKSDESFAPHSLCDLLDKTIELAENDYDLKQKFDFRQIEIVERYDKAMPQVTCEGSKIQLVILNILKNGAQAMAESKNKEEAPRFILRVMQERGMARVEISDNGPGMDETTCRRVFEPFYTTKPVGSGTGLGMSVSYFIITENHRGTMEVESAPGKGAKFIIRLPFERNVH